MADVTKFKTPDNERPSAAVGDFYVINRTIAVVSGDCPQNDNIVVQDLPAGHVVIGGVAGHSATLGASATAKLRAGTTALTAATTAGGASYVPMSVAHAVNPSAEQTLNVLIEGAAIAASANIYVFAIVAVTKAAQL